MTNVSRAMLSLVPWLVALLLVGPVSDLGGRAAFAEKPKAAKPAAETGAGHGKANVCGCYKDASGSCLCGRKAHCGCPGECEPRGCAEKHDRDIEKEIKAETKRAQDLERKQKTANKRKDADSEATTTDDEHKTEARKAKTKRPDR